MRILFTSIEAYPFAKVGGLGDVAGSLPKALARLGHEVNVVMPRHRGMDRWRVDLGPFNVPMGDRKEVAALKEGNLSHSVPVLMVDHLGFFDRGAVYGYEDDGKRFAFFSRAVLEACRYVDFRPDIIHCNDWHTALIPAYLRAHYSQDKHFSRTGTLLTIHNMHHQGQFPRELLDYLDLPEELSKKSLLHHDKVNILKAGITLSDAINTVSETYAREIQTPEYGSGLHDVLRKRRDSLYGVLNGIDLEVWDPRTDAFLYSRYEPSDLRGKEANKRALQRELGLPRSRMPVMAFIGRLVEQKGVDVLLQALAEILSRKVQVVILGAGKEATEEALSSLIGRNPNLVVHLGHDEALAHRVYAGADMFLMPSRFEPCGLGQIISMRYGTIPIVRKTGGLADTVQDYSVDPGKATGFTFDKPVPEALLEAIDRALEVHKRGPAWRRLQANGFNQDFSWERSARTYEEIYGSLIHEVPGQPA